MFQESRTIPAGMLPAVHVPVFHNFSPDQHAVCPGRDDQPHLRGLEPEADAPRSPAQCGSC